MQVLILAENFVAALKRTCKGDKLKKSFQKVEIILEEYAIKRKIKYEELRVLDISDIQGELQPSLLRFIQSAPRLPGQTEKRYKRYISEKASGIRRLIRTILGLTSNYAKSTPTQAEVVSLDIPEYIKPLLEKLPKVLGNTDGSAKTNTPITELTGNGMQLLLAVCRVDAIHYSGKERPTLEDLLLDHNKDLRAELRFLASSPAQWDSSSRSLYTLLEKLELKVKPSIPAMIKFENWPQPLQDQYKRYKELASGTISPSATLQESAIKHEFSLKPHREGSIKRVFASIAQVLGIIPHTGTLSIEDLLRLKPIEVITEEGLSIENRNSYVDHVRDVERAKFTDSKRTNFDTTLFGSFIVAIKAIAARTGYGHLIKVFNQLYQVRLDKETKKARKAAKKQGIPRSWIDDQLTNIGEEFDRIVKKGLFKRVPGRSRKESNRATWLCLFYPQALTMRLMGYRQQAIRKCLVGSNIKFLSDGTIILHFNPCEVKNGRTLHMKIEPSKEGMHERLREVLIKYYEKVLPYVRKYGAPELEQQFFVQFNSNKGLFRPFKDAVDYKMGFSRRVSKFFNTRELEPHMRDKLHPHFLRGVCVDWMILDLHMTFAEAAEVLGDSEEVLKREYLDQNRVYDATPAFNRINFARLVELKSKGDVHAQFSNVQIEQGFQAILRSKDREIESLTETLNLIQEQFTSEVATLRAQIASAKIVNGVISATG